MASPDHRPVRRPSLWKAVAAAALVYPMVVAALVHDAAIRDWLRAYGSLERSGPAASFHVMQAALVERSSLVASDPSSKALEGATGLQGALGPIMSGLTAMIGEEHGLYTRFGSPDTPGLDWNAPEDSWANVYRAKVGYVTGRYMVVSLYGSASSCPRFLDGLSPYALSRARGAWSRSYVSPGLADLPGVSWGEMGDAPRTCREGGHADLDWFLLRFDLQQPPLADSGSGMAR